MKSSSGIKKVIAGMLILAMCSMVMVGCSKDKAADSGNKEAGSKLVTAGSLTVGSDCDYPPFIQLTSEGKPEGFEYELLEAMAKKMNLKLVFLSPQAFDTLIPQISAGGKMDLAASSITITPERKEQVAFTDSYFTDGVSQAISVPAGSLIKTQKDLSGKKVGAQSGTTGESWAKENAPDAKVVGFANVTDVFNAMMAGKVDAAVNDSQTAEQLISKSFPSVHVAETIPTAEEYGFAVSKDNPQLVKDLNKALKAVIDDGTYETIYKKWFSGL